MANSRRVDAVVYKGYQVTRTWYIKQVVNGVATDYDLSAKTVTLKVYDRSNPEVLLYTISPIDKGLGYVVFEFTPAQSTQTHLVDYLIEEEIAPGNLVLLVLGTIAFVDASHYIPFRDIVVNETPGGLTIPENFVTIKSFEWRLFLQNAIDPAISDEDVSSETAWPTLVNFLIAKLVVHDYIVKSLKSLLAKNDATDESNTAGVKKIETGPSNAEFFDPVASMTDFLKVDKNGNSALTSLASDICQLARRLSIYLPMCNNMDRQAIFPVKSGRPETLDEITILTKYFS